LEEILRPSSRRKSTADSLIGPSVSTAISWEIRVFDFFIGYLNIIIDQFLINQPIFPDLLQVGQSPAMDLQMRV